MSVEVDASRTLSGLANLEAGVMQAIGLTMRSAIEATEQSAKSTELFKDKSGKTRQSIKGEYHGVQAGGFVQAGGASKFLENGTRAHVIMGRPLLRFVVNGETIYRRMVRHPGTAERPFMREARAVGERAADYGGDFFIGEAIRRAR